jgi:hypothetical protein
MGPYKKHIRFFIVLFLFTLIVAGVRLYWIKKALPSKATVLYIDHTRFTHPMQYYPVVSYQTRSGEVVTRGTYNLPINTGQTVDILYNPDDMQEFRLNATYWLWYDIWSWYRMIWIAIAMYYLVHFIVKRSSRHATWPVVENGGESDATIGLDYSRTDPVSIETVTVSPVGIAKSTKRLPRVVKAVLLLLLPVSVFLVGHIWDVPYARQIAVVVFLGIIALGSPSGPAPDGDI